MNVATSPKTTPAASTATPPAATCAAADALPDDPEILKRMIAELLATLRERDRKCEQLAHRLDQLLRRLYGSRSEKFDPNQPWLFPELAELQEEKPASDNPVSPVEEKSAAKKPIKGHGRNKLPDSLPRVREIHDLPEAERGCPGCGSPRCKIGEQISEQLDYVPASLFVVQHVQISYACPQCQGCVTTAPKPPQPIDKGLPGPGLLAAIITSKYFDHLPLYRLERIFGRHGLELPRSTTCGWMAACAMLLTPLYDTMVSLTLQSLWLFTDDTTLPTLDDKSDHALKAKIWTYVGDRDHPCNVFDYTPTRQRDGPQSFLKNFKGFLHADAYTGYDSLFLGSPPRVIEVACNAHARRKFHEAKKSDAARSHAALAWYQQLYAIEKEAREIIEKEKLDGPAADAVRLRLRQEKAVPVWRQFKAWLDEQKSQVLPKSPMAEAIGYALNHWDAFLRHTQYGFLEIDNNLAEREMKRIAIGRKNYLFVGSQTGGRTAAILYSFTSTCFRHGIDPFAYLKDILTRLALGPLTNEQLEALLPHRWKATQPSTDKPAE